MSIASCTPPAITGASPGQALSPGQIAEFAELGYLTGLPAFDAEGVRQNQALFSDLVASLPPGKNAFDINGWHKLEPRIYRLLTHPAILAAVSSLIGEDVLLWGSHFFCKQPRDAGRVAWHQDARYWPLAPHRTVTVWLAIDDSSIANGAMRLIPRTHSMAWAAHRQVGAGESVLGLELEDGGFDVLESVPIELEAGSFSLHDDNLVHGSPGNHSSSRRCGLTARYMPPEVRCDRSIWPGFSAIVVQGQDRIGSNPLIPPPRADARPSVDELLGIIHDYTRASGEVIRGASGRSS